MRKVSLRWTFLASLLAMGMTVSARAQGTPTIHATPHNNEVNLINFAGGPQSPPPLSTGGYVLTNSNVAAAGTASNPIIANTPGTSGVSILTALYGAGNYTQITTPAQTPNLNGINLMATVKYAAANENLGYYRNGTGALSSILQVGVAPGSNGFYAAGQITVTNGGGATQLGTNSFLLTPGQSGNPFEFALQVGGTGGAIYSQNLTSVGSGVTDDGVEHLAEFQITGGANAGALVLAWEDGPAGQFAPGVAGDGDYNDLVIQINVLSVPEPSTMALAGLGALGLIGYGLRRRKAKGA
jgi:hypothetical protein